MKLSAREIGRCPLFLRKSQPKDAPRGTRSIDQVYNDHDKIEEIKEWAGARADDYVCVTNDGRIITTNPETGSAIDHGHYPFF